MRTWTFQGIAMVNKPLAVCRIKNLKKGGYEMVAGDGKKSSPAINRTLFLLASSVHADSRVWGFISQESVICRARQPARGRTSVEDRQTPSDIDKRHLCERWGSTQVRSSRLKRGIDYPWFVECQFLHTARRSMGNSLKKVKLQSWVKAEITINGDIFGTVNVFIRLL